MNNPPVISDSVSASKSPAPQTTGAAGAHVKKRKSRRGVWAVIGVGACAAACAAPILLGASVVGVGISAAAEFPWWVAAVAAMGIGWAAWRVVGRRRSKAEEPEQCSTDQSCSNSGCGC